MSLNVQTILVPVRSDLQVTDGSSGVNMSIILKQFGIVGAPSWLDLAASKQSLGLILIFVNPLFEVC